jgi:ubiquinone/menaquinone biosynthesis C-methylase UbiE
MLNPTFNKKLSDKAGLTYIAPNEVAISTIAGNQSFDAGKEYRLESVFGDEIWKKINAAGLTRSLDQMTILEVCAGSGFMTYHILSRCNPKLYVVNDISKNELDLNKQLILDKLPSFDRCEWVLGDLHQIKFDEKFDLIIGNSFIHQFHNVPQVMHSISSFLKPGGFFVSLHEPTLMATVLESGKAYIYPFAVLFPKWVNEVARKRYKGEPSQTDLWLFECDSFGKILRKSYSHVEFQAWGLLRPFLVRKFGFILDSNKTSLSNLEKVILKVAICVDSILRRVLPLRFFGSICIVCQK